MQSGLPRGSDATTAGRTLAREAVHLLRARLTAQLLAGAPAGSPEAVAGHLLAIQAQDLRGARLAIRARSRSTLAADVDHAMTIDRSLVVTWLNRGTLHLVRAVDYAWLHALTMPSVRSGTMRRLAQEGVTPDAGDRGVVAIERALAAEGPLTRGQLRDRLDAAGVRTQGQALVHILALASIGGLIVRGPIVGGEHAFVLVRDWLGPTPHVQREAALAELARRYLAGHGPADERDLAGWAGVTLRDARAGLLAIKAELVEADDGLVDLAQRDAAAPLPPPRLLGPFDPVLHGWRSRALVLGEHQRVVTINGLFRAFAMVRGRAVATWTLNRGAVRLAPFDVLAPGIHAALAAEAEDVQRFLTSR